MNDKSTPLPDAVRRVVEDSARLDVLHSLAVLDTPPDNDFDRLARMSASMLGTRIAQISLVNREREWRRACHGLEGLIQIDIETSFCAHTIASSEDHMIVPDLLEDRRFASNPFVTGWPDVRFYAGAPVVVRGQRVGTVCVLDTQPRKEIPSDLVCQLRDLSDVAASLFSLKDEARVRARTAAALMKEEWRHALTLEAGKVGSWIWEISTGELTCNDIFRQIFALPENGVIMAEQVWNATHPLDVARVQAGLAASLEGGADYDCEARVGRSGRWVSMRGRVYQRDADGRALVMMGTGIDITEARTSADHTRLLLRELNHRVKNTLAMIHSVARQTIHETPDPKAFMEAFTGRLRTLSDAHVLLADRDWQGIGLMEVVEAQIGTKALGSSAHAAVSGQDMTLPPDHALGLALILHELTTNALKHGAWSQGEGRVEIDWTLEEGPDRGLRLQWRERGGPKVSRPKRKGLGLRLVERGLAKIIDSEVDLQFSAEGVMANIWMPLPAA
ncbi:MAG: PAS domain-containing protein [Devosia sp.]|nr:PAS domain-containing protein [Devosia sp.]